MVWADNLERTSDRTWHRQAGAALGLDVGADAARSECRAESARLVNTENEAEAIPLLNRRLRGGKRGRAKCLI